MRNYAAQLVLHCYPTTVFPRRRAITGKLKAHSLQIQKNCTQLRMLCRRYPNIFSDYLWMGAPKDFVRSSRPEVFCKKCS